MQQSQQVFAPVQLLNEYTKNSILELYKQEGNFLELDYATVKDYCDSADRLPQICYLDGDLKNVQRPWTVKAILNKVPCGSRLLEIGGGIPLVAGMLTELGYKVTLVDPYEGAGNGPVEYERYLQQFPNVDINKNLFDVNLSGYTPGSFDCIYSVSVLEHIPKEGIKPVFEGIRKFLRPGGFSIHCVDHVIQGAGTESHEDTLKVILHEQRRLQDADYLPNNEYEQLLIQLKDDIETFYLSALGHHQWRGGLPYEQFPFRKVVSIQTCVALK